MENKDEEVLEISENEQNTQEEEVLEIKEEPKIEEKQPVESIQTPEQKVEQITEEQKEIIKKLNRKEKNKALLIVAICILVPVLGIIIFDLFFWPSVRANIMTEWKPIIYIYPEKDMNVSISVSNPENLTITYPKYEKGWEVKALTDGTLIDKNGKSYYALYWEGKQKNISKVKEDGFVIKGEETAEFLEEKLELLGLNYKEKNEFIMYWLPKLENNKYNYIRFETIEEMNKNMELYITPKPDSLIRVRMDYKALDKKIKVKEQELTTPERTGYTVVEWGGVEI